MPILAALAILLLVIVLGIALIPISIVQRYRVGTSRRQARRWLATVNLAAAAISTGLFVFTAAITAFWVPRALVYTLLGVAAGALLGVIGLLLTRWEPEGELLHFTPNRILVLAIVLAIAGRIGYSIWRSWESWQSGVHGGSWVVRTGAAESLAAGAVVLGYYLAYWWGVRRRLDRHNRLRIDSSRFAAARPLDAPHRPPPSPGGRHA
jgi:hypothetical protein